MIKFQKKLEKNSQEIDRFLDSYLPSGNGLSSKLFEAMRYSSISGGKKIRAYLVLETGRFISAINNKTLSKSKYNELIAVGSAIEAIHSYSLIHDDLPAMDNSPVRRGKAANHVKFDHHTAILAGDGLLSWAFQIIGDRNLISNSEKRSEICFMLAKAIGPNGMVGGQQADMDFAKHKFIDFCFVTSISACWPPTMPFGPIAFAKTKQSSDLFSELEIKLLSPIIWKAQLNSPSPASIAVWWSNFTWLAAFPLLTEELSIAGKSSWINE